MAGTKAGSSCRRSQWDRPAGEGATLRATLATVLGLPGIDTKRARGPAANGADILARLCAFVHATSGSPSFITSGSSVRAQAGATGSSAGAGADGSAGTDGPDGCADGSARRITEFLSKQVPSMMRKNVVFCGLPVSVGAKHLAIAPGARERLGYPTQKPEALLERVVEAASNPGDLVLDPFLGSGTTAVVPLRLGREFVGCDRSPEAIAVTRARVDAFCPGLVSTVGDL